MKVTIEKKATETIDVEPGYYKSKEFGSSFYHLLTSGVVVYLSNDMIYFETPDQSNHASDLRQIAKSYIPCSQAEFEAAKDKMLVTLKNYVSFPETATVVNPPADSPAHHTMFDPNNTQQEPASEQPTQQATPEQVAAVEQEAQEQAMQSAEEGGAEG